ncbi:MAG: flippase-like domain-containing protein [Chloroflexota bacterium]|nr:flippase-like domain-containing protein [Chloroflexota bacterium]
MPPPLASDVPPPPPRPAGWRRTLPILRPLVSLALLALLFSRFGAGEVWQTLREADLRWLAFGGLVALLAMAVSAWKWQLLLSAQGLLVPFRVLFSSYLVGLFFNNFLPSNIGGDVARVHDVARYTGNATGAAASVIGERLLAGLALGLTAMGALLFSFRSSAPVAGTVAIVLLLFGALVASIASSGVRRALSDRFPRLRDSIVGRIGGQMGGAFSQRGKLLSVMVLSLAFHATVVLLGWATFVAIGAPVSLGACFLFIPIISAIQLIPISLNGFGVREGAYVFFFGSAGLAAPQAVAASLLFAIVVSVVSLSGGAIFALRR